MEEHLRVKASTASERQLSVRTAGGNGSKRAAPKGQTGSQPTEWRSKHDATVVLTYLTFGSPSARPVLLFWRVRTSPLLFVHVRLHRDRDDYKSGQVRLSYAAKQSRGSVKWQTGTQQWKRSKKWKGNSIFVESRNKYV